MVFEVDAITDAGWTRFGPDRIDIGLSVAKDLAQHDLEVVRPALLYADHVTLLSGNFLIGYQLSNYVTRMEMPLQAAKLFAVLSVDSGREQLRAFGVEDRLLPPEPDARAFLDRWRDSVRQATGMDREQALEHTSAWIQGEVTPFLHRWSQGFEQFHERLYQHLQAERDALFADELDEAITRGVLSVEPQVDWDLVAADFEPLGWTPAFVDAYRNEALDAMVARMSSSAATPLLDPWSAEVARQEDILRPDAAARTLATSFGARLLATTPAVRDAPIGEILDCRDEMRDELTLFRAAMFEAAEAFLMSDAEDGAAWLQDYTDRTIEPALVEIRAAAERNRYVGELIDVVTDPAQLIAPGSLLIGATAVDGGLGSLVAGGLGLALPLAKAARKWQQAGAEVRQKPFFLLHQLGRGN